ncbi:MAG: hypothetical protein CR975_05190 [Gammaproteobacteria bacterium]|nr:MAG: hypothetical protein CR975_05190 [Gammaproteobacteria bacterium]
MEVEADNVYAPPKADLTPGNQHGKGEVTTLMVDHLQTAGKWANFLAILGYIGVTLFVLSAAVFLFALFFGTSLGRGRGIDGDSTTIILGLAVILISAFFTFKLSRFLRQYARLVGNLSETYDALDLIAAQEYFVRYSKWSSILLAIFTVLTMIAYAIRYIFSVGV